MSNARSPRSPFSRMDVDLCETVLKMVVAPNIRRNAQAKIAEILALKESTHAPH